VPPGPAAAIRRARHSWRAATARPRALPSFIIIGTQKGGTTSLHDYLLAHPDVRPGIGKGIHYFDELYERGPRWYRSNFPILRPGQITGEASPDYMPHRDVPRRVAGLLPDVRLIALLREPVARAHSHYVHNRSKGYELRSFEQAVDDELATLPGESDAAAFDRSPDQRARWRDAYVARGFYAEQLDRWRAVFPAEQLLVLRSEDLYADPAATTARACTFLGLGDRGPGRYRALNARSYEDLDPDLADRLRAVFAPHAAALADRYGSHLTWT
jgi:hypothetical protein